MTKRLKYTLLIIFAAIAFAFVGFGLLLPGVVFADLKDGNNLFKFDGSCYFYYQAKEGDLEATDFRLSFKLDKLTPKYDDVRDELQPWWGHLEKPHYTYTAEVYRNGEETPLVKETITYWQNGNSANIVFSRQKFVYYDEIIEFAEPMFTAAGGTVKEKSPTEDEGYIENRAVGNLDFKKQQSGFDNVNPFILINIIPQSAMTQYYVKFSYSIFRYTDNGMFTNYSETKSGTCETDARSLYDKFSEMQNLGVLSDQLFGNAYEFADKVVNKKDTKSITVKYLTQIAGTPFATRTTKTGKVKFSNKITDEDVQRDFGISSDCIESVLDGFTQEGTTYTANYRQGKFLKAHTTDGNEDIFYFDINKSFKDFYTPFVDLGLMDAGAFDVTFTQKVYAPYKEKLASYDPATIHGYFGFVVIPRSRTLNALFAEIFDVKNCKAGAVYGLDYGVSLTPANYNKLLQDFHYSYLKQAWNGFIDLLNQGEDNATAYILYVRPEDSTTFINESGSDDPDDNSGAIGNVFNDTIGAVTGFFGDAWNTVTGFFGGLSGTWKAIIAVAILAAVVAVMVAFRKYKK